MQKVEDYIPAELFREAADFIRHMDENVEIYRIFRKSNFTSPCTEADKFTAYWTFSSYNSYPHALITLYEHTEEIENSFGPVNSDNVFESLQYKLKCYYLLLRENNLTGE